MSRRTLLAAVVAALLAGCQPASSTAPAQPSPLVTEAMAVAGTPVTLAHTVMLTLESPQSERQAGRELGDHGRDRLTIRHDAAGRYRFDMDDDNREGHALEVFDAEGGSLLRTTAGGPEPVLELPSGDYTLELTHSGIGGDQVAFVHERPAGDLREIAVSVNHVRGANLRGADLQGARLAGVVFQDCDLRLANFRGADLTDAAVLSCRTVGADMTGAMARGYTVLSWGDGPDTRRYVVIENHDSYHTIWPQDRELPLGWRGIGKSGTRQECLDYIETLWTDMRPQSLRQKEQERQRQQEP